MDINDPAVADTLTAIATNEPVLLSCVDLGEMPPGTFPPPFGEPPPPEPVFDLATRQRIQGNIVPGFNKDHQHLLFVRFGDAAAARRWVGALAPMVTSMDAVLEFVREHRARRLAEGVREPAGMRATWVSVAFSYDGIALLAGGGVAKAFTEPSFVQGLAARSEYLGDPTSPEHPGHRSHWLVGGPDNAAHAIVVVAADDPDDRDSRAAEIVGMSGGVEILHDEPADALPDALRGHEHFGFKDGVSQPAARGRLSDDEFLARRLLEPDPTGEDVRPQLFARPGQPLVWPGQFLLGEPRQATEDVLGADTSAGPAAFPDWASHGSYLVFRRLRQDVAAFWDFAAEAAARTGTTPLHLAAMMVGRWPSGAPLMRVGAEDEVAAALAGDQFADNHFLFDDPTRPVTLRPIKGYGGDHFPQAKGDVLGRVCPHFAHIRKTNPRDSTSELGKPQDNLMRMVLRRGIAYGDPLVGVEHPSQELVDADRGLMFLCFGSSIEDQFEFLTRRWANNAVQPNAGGHDPVIGQADRRGDRERYVEVPVGDDPPVRVAIARDFVWPTGGGYFFAPPIPALTDVLGDA